MKTFQFKRFSIINDCSAMKVNTDGVLLGASAFLPKTDDFINVLDVGTGTGTIALMLAQRLEPFKNYHITGVDIDEASAREAALNFKTSPWSDKMTSIHSDFTQCDGLFDLIVSNPPYFKNSLKNPDTRKAGARHSDSLSFKSIIDFSDLHLSASGLLSLILPIENETEVIRYGNSKNIHPFNLIRIHTVYRKDPSRIIIEFSRKKRSLVETSLTIKENNTYSSEYRNLVKDFYTWA